jgi:hypothetical protein
MGAHYEPVLIGRVMNLSAKTGGALQGTTVEEGDDGVGK